MKVFIYVNGKSEPLSVQVEESFLIGDLIKQSFSLVKNEPDFKEDLEVYLENSKEDFDKGKSLKECGIKHGDRIFIGKCKDVVVQVTYMGRTLNLYVPPAQTIRRLKKVVAKEFGMSEEEVSDFEFYHNDKAVEDIKVMIGTYVQYPECMVSFVFASKGDINGFYQHPEDILKNHLINGNYQTGVISECWGEVQMENGPEWPIFFFWVSANDGSRYNFRFDLSNYPKNAPTAQIWDVENNKPLNQEKRPNWSKRCRDVFKHWGKNCLYLPCDRMALPGHNDWSQKHSQMIWNEEKDDITKYLNILYDALN